MRFWKREKPLIHIETEEAYAIECPYTGLLYEYLVPEPEVFETLDLDVVQEQENVVVVTKSKVIVRDLDIEMPTTLPYSAAEIRRQRESYKKSEARYNFRNHVGGIFLKDPTKGFDLVFDYE